MNDPRTNDGKDDMAPATDVPDADLRDVDLPDADLRDADPPDAGAASPPSTEPAEHTATDAVARRPQASAGRSMSVVLGLLALLIASAAIGGVVFTWWQLREESEVVATQRAEASDTLADIRELVASTEERLAVQEERLTALHEEASERRRRLDGMDAELRQARTRLESLAVEDAGAERSPSLAEIEYLLLVAGRELALADNPRVALAALREADQRVARLDDPGLAPVRAAINDEIAAVEAVVTVDLDGIALRLGSLARRVDGLPLKGSLAPEPESAAQAADGAGWDRLVARMRAVGAGLFRIRRTDTPASPLLAPDESFFLYRNVELDLKSARLAVLARDADNYVESLEAARQALNEYFETGDDAVRSLIDAIGQLEAQDIAPAWPEISRSLAALRSAGAPD